MVFFDCLLFRVQGVYVGLQSNILAVLIMSRAYLCCPRYRPSLVLAISIPRKYLSSPRSEMLK